MKAHEKEINLEYTIEQTKKQSEQIIPIIQNKTESKIGRSEFVKLMFFDI